MKQAIHRQKGQPGWPGLHCCWAVWSFRNVCEVMERGKGTTWLYSYRQLGKQGHLFLLATKLLEHSGAFQVRQKRRQPVFEFGCGGAWRAHNGSLISFPGAPKSTLSDWIPFLKPISEEDSGFLIRLQPHSPSHACPTETQGSTETSHVQFPNRETFSKHKSPCQVPLLSSHSWDLTHINIVHRKQFVGDVISTLPQSRHSLDTLARLP